MSNNSSPLAYVISHPGRFLLDVLRSFRQNQGLLLAGAIAYYTLLSIIPVFALVLIVLCYLWIGLNETAAIIAVTLNKIPNVTTIIREGGRALDPNLKAMGQVFAMRRGTYLRHVVLPQLSPFIAAAARSGIAVIWKIVLVVEFLGRSNGVGFQIHLYFQLFDVAMVLVYSLSFIAVMLLVEWLVLQPWERRVRRWRDA